MALAEQTYISSQEYLAGEKESSTRHEYVDGQVYAMAGSSRQHNRIALNIVKALDQHDDCEVYASDIKVHIASRNSYYYPDVVMDCSKDINDDYYLENPCLITEVLSSSTVRKDYQEKLLAYQAILSLQAYLIVAQDKIQIDYFYRDDKGSWWVDHISDQESVIELPCAELSLSVSDVYQRVGLLDS